MNVCIIPAKGTSTRIPRKNIGLFHGKPIIAYSIETALRACLFSSVIVSTDDDEIGEIAQRCGADVLMRGAKWCGDDVGPLDVARHSLTLVEDVSLLCVVYATAPLMTTGSIMRGFSAVKREGVAYAVSVGTKPFLHDAAQFFWCQPWALRERFPEFSERTVLIDIPPETDCDINVETDWVRAEQMYAELHGDKNEVNKRV